MRPVGAGLKSFMHPSLSSWLCKARKWGPGRAGRQPLGRELGQAEPGERSGERSWSPPTPVP